MTATKHLVHDVVPTPEAPGNVEHCMTFEKLTFNLVARHSGTVHQLQS
jgi:hypothetical protein